MIIKSKNITTIFIVPTLGIDKKILSENGFISGYLDDYDYDVDYENVVYLVFKPKDQIKFNLFLEEIYNNNPLVVEDYNNEKNDIIVIFKIKEEFKKDYDLILAGKYSKTSKEFQKCFPETVIVNDEVKVSLQKLIFDKSPKLARYWADFLNDDDIIKNKLELWPAPDLKNEILNYECKE